MVEKAQEEQVQDVQILVEFPARPGLQQASLFNLSREEWAEKSKEALDDAMGLITRMAGRVSALRESIPDEFSQVEVEFGAKLDYEAGALLTKAGAEGSITVKLTCERPEKPVPTLPPVRGETGHSTPSET